MLEEFILNTLASTTISSMLVGAGAWIARSWLSERLRNSIRTEYDQKLETHKAQLKAHSDATLERIRADLSIAALEHQIKFSRLHEERANVIAETYALLKELHVMLSDYVKIFEPVGDKSKEERRKAVQQAHECFITYYRIKRIFIPELAATKIDLINKQFISLFYRFLYEIEALQEQGKHDVNKWNEIFQEVQEEIPVALKELERDFRTLLGDKGEHQVQEGLAVTGEVSSKS